MSTLIANDVYLHQLNSNKSNLSKTSIPSNSMNSSFGTNVPNSTNSVLCCDHKQIIRNQLSRIELLESELISTKCERDVLLAENEKLCFQMQMLSECYNGTKRNFADLQMNGAFLSNTNNQEETIDSNNVINKTNKNLNENNALSNDKMIENEQIYEPNNNNLNQVCKQEQLRIMNQNLDQPKDLLEESETDEQKMNLLNNLNTFNILQQNYNDQQTKNQTPQYYQTLYGHHRSTNSSNSLLNSSTNSNKNIQSNISSQLSQYELKPGQILHQYELSQEMLDKRVELLMRKYGDRAWSAAMLIQRFWRKRQMSKRFKNIASGNQQSTSQLKENLNNKQSLTSTSTNDLNLKFIDSKELNSSTSDDSQIMDLMEVSNSEIIITDKQHPINNGNNTLNNSQQKLINATLEALKTPLAECNNQKILASKGTLTNGNRSIMKRYSNASLQSTSSSSSSSNNSMPRSPTMPSLQKNIFNNNTNSIVSSCSTTTPGNNASHILLNSSPIHPNNFLPNGQSNTPIIYSNSNNVFTSTNSSPYSNVCVPSKASYNLINSAILNPYFKPNPNISILSSQHSLLNTLSPATLQQHLHNLSSNTINGSTMSLQSCMSNNVSRQSILSNNSTSSLLNGSPQQLHQQLVKQQQIQISHYETVRKRQYRIGLNLFNKKPPERGIQYLIENGFIDVNLLNYAGFLIDNGLDSGLGSLSSGCNSESNNGSSNNSSSKKNQPTTTERDLQLSAAVARFLLTRKGLSKQMIGEYLGNLQQPFNQLVLKFFVKQMDLSGLLIDVALRKFQTYFRFPGEAQKIEKLVEVFSEKYFQANFENGINPALIDCYTAAAIESERLTNGQEPNQENIGLRVLTKDEIFILSFAIIMLNTDLHIPNNKRRMTSQQWIKNLKGVFKEGGDLDDFFLLDIYERIKQNEFKTGHDHCNHVLKVQQTLVPGSSSKQVPNLCLTSYRRLVCFCRLYEIVDINKKTTKAGQHQREVFLFNDMLLITKLAKSGTFTGASSITNSNGHSSSAATHNQYSYRKSILLSGCTVSLFSTNYYPFGIKLNQKINTSSNNSSQSNKTIIMFNARNDIDRKKFYEDLKESIAEITEMEMIRISATNGLSNNNSNISSSSSTSSSLSSASSTLSSSSNFTQAKNVQNSKHSPIHTLKNKSNSLLDLVFHH